MERKYKIRIRLLSIILIILLCIGSVVKCLQNDTFYIIKLGSDILKNGVDLVDHYCWITNLNYTYPQFAEFLRHYISFRTREQEQLQLFFQ